MKHEYDIITSCMLLSNKIISTILAHYTLLWLTDKIELLFNFNGSETNNKSNISLCKFMKEFLLKSCGISPKSLQLLFNKHIVNERCMKTFFTFINEAFHIVAALLKLKTFEITSNGDFIVTPNEMSKSFIVIIDKLFRFLWKLLLLITIDESKNDANLCKIKLATTLIRFSIFVENEDQITELINRVNTLLKSVNIGVMETKTIEDLENVIGIYGVNIDSDIVNSLIKSNNGNKDHIDRKNNDLYSILRQDKRYCSFIVTLKKTLIKEEILKTSLAYAEKINKEFKKSLSKLNKYTNIPENIVISRKNNKWSLKESKIFANENNPETNDEIIKVLLEKISSNPLETPKHNINDYFIYLKKLPYNKLSISKIPYHNDTSITFKSKLEIYHREL